MRAEELKVEAGPRRLVWERLGVFAALLMALTVVLAGRDRLYTISADLPLHYDLVNQIAKTWVWPSFGPPLLTNMEAYPPISHYLAAIIGVVVGSSFLGMNIVCLLAVFSTYYFLVRPLCTGPALGTAAAVALAAVLVYGARSQYAAEGYEVYYNYFFAQMVGQAAFLAFASWICVSSLDWKRRLAVTMAATLVGGWLYTITAVEIALAFLALETLVLGRRIVRDRNFHWSWGVPVAAGCLVLPPMVLINPKFQFMVVVARNNGGLGLLALERLVPWMAAVLLVLCLIMGLFVPASQRWRKGGLGLAVAGSATALITLIQVVFLYAFHTGSDYAIKKYGFGVVALLTFNLAMAIAVLIDGRRPKPAPGALAALAAPIIAAVATLAAPAYNPYQRIEPFLKYQKYMRRTLELPEAPAHPRGQIASLNPAFAWWMNYAATAVDLGMGPRAMDVIQIPFDPARPPPIPYAFVADPDHMLSDQCAPPQTRTGPMVLVSVDCDRRFGMVLRPGAVVRLADHTGMPRYVGSGWGAREGDGAWAGDGDAHISFQVELPDKPVHVQFEGRAFLAHPDSRQRVLVKAKGKLLAEWVFDAKSPHGKRDVTATPEVFEDGKLKLTFSFPDATSPMEQKVSTDPRRLSMFLVGFTVDPH